MTKRTKKAGSVARFGPRYGVKIRRRIQDIEKISRHRHVCPKCQHKSVKRISTGVYNCAHCDNTYASSAYYPLPPAPIRKMISEEERELGKESEEEVQTEDESAS